MSSNTASNTALNTTSNTGAVWVATMRTGMGIALSMWLAACGGGVPYVMQVVEGREVAPPAEGMAGVIFVMPGGRGDPVSFVDESGAFLGQVRAGSYLVREVSPGPHRFYALRGADAYAVRADFEAGRTYHVLVEAGTLAGIRFVALRPSDTARWIRRDRYLSDARRVDDDPAADRRALDRVLGNVPQRILEADMELSAMTPAEQAERTLARADGIFVAAASETSATDASGAAGTDATGATAGTDTSGGDSCVTDTSDAEPAGASGAAATTPQPAAP